MGDNPAAWPALEDGTLKELVALKLLEYEATQDSRRISDLLGLYRYLMERIPVSGRMKMLTEFSGLAEKHQGLGRMGLRIFLCVDTDPGIRASAAKRLGTNAEI